MKQELKWLYVRWLLVRAYVLCILACRADRLNVRLHNAAYKAEAEFMDAWVDLTSEDIPEL